MDLFEAKQISPMLIGKESGPFDDPACIFELKLDGVRCVAYLDKSGVMELRNKRNLNVGRIYPELQGMEKQVKKRCILDGELTVFKDGTPCFSEMQRRSLMSDPFKIQLAAKELPVNFTAFDILYLEDREVMSLPLMERKALLKKNMRETPKLAVSRYIEEQGAALYDLAKAKELEGVVAKYKDSRYHTGKRTKDWIKIKYLQDDDFVVCGWIPKEHSMTSIVLGQYDSGGILRYMGHVTLGVSGKNFARVRAHLRAQSPPFSPIPKGNKNAVWIKPDLVCTVSFMERTESGSMRQPVFKGLREDKLPTECKINE